MTDLTASNQTTTTPDFEEVVRQRMSRRGALKAMVVIGGGAAAGTAIATGTAHAYVPGELTFDAITPNTNDQITVPTGFKHDVLISWGDPVVPGAPAFDVTAQTAAKQAQQFGFNNDYVDIRPLPYAFPENTSAPVISGLLWVNHEYTSANMMFPGVTYTGFNSAAATTAEQKLIEIEAHGASIVKVQLNSGTNTWSYNPADARNRRITGSTPITITGPAAGNVHMQTTADPAGTTVKGMLNNCGGGHTPWGSILTAEENFDQYFSNRGTLDAANPADSPAVQALKLYAKDNASVFGIPTGASSRGWEDVDTRFDMRVEWNEPHRFGWIVEVNPYSVDSVPKKRTALGRFKHEAAATHHAANGKLAVYMGDDQAGQFIYKFVTANNVGPTLGSNNNLLDSGTLYVAKFNSDGTGTWMPLVFGTGPLVSPAFADQADVLIRTRVAAAALGATPMDRPEDVEVNPVSGFVYAAMTGTSRSAADAANPRISSGATDPNSARGGHIIEIREAGNDHTATTFQWEIFMLCGTPNAGGTLDATTFPAGANSGGRTYYAGFDESQVSPISRPDNVNFDSLGNLWIATDGMPTAANSGGLGFNDSLFGVPTAGAERGHLKAFLSGPKGAEMASLYMASDDETMFASVQHPGEDGNNATPQSAWNSVATSGPTSVIARNAVVAVRRLDQTSIPAGGAIVPPPEVPEFPLPAVAVGTAAALGGLVAWRQRRMSAGPA